VTERVFRMPMMFQAAYDANSTRMTSRIKKLLHSPSHAKKIAKAKHSRANSFFHGL
jgi:hypothetical protein